MYVFFFKQKTAYEMRISDWSSDVCSSAYSRLILKNQIERISMRLATYRANIEAESRLGVIVDDSIVDVALLGSKAGVSLPSQMLEFRSEEHTSELQSLMRISYAVFCLKKKKLH